MDTAPAPAASIKKHSAGLIPIWCILTLGFYWPFWLYRTYKEIRAHVPDATTITPGKAVGFLLIPIFAVYWFFRIVIDLPRAIAQMQKSCYPQEEQLPAGAVSAMLAIGMVLSVVGAYVHPVTWFAGLILALTAIVSCQQAMNGHTENHVRALRGQPIVEASGERSFARLIGARGGKIEWRRVAVLAVSLAVMTPVYLGFVSSHLSPSFLLPSFLQFFSPSVLLKNLYGFSLYALALTGVAVIVLRYVRSYWLASLVAALIWAPLSYFVLGRNDVGLTGTLAGAAQQGLKLALLCVFVQVVRSAWVGLGLGMACGRTATAALWAIALPPHQTLYDSINSPEQISIEAAQFTGEIAAAIVFAIAFWLLRKLLLRSAAASA